MIIHIVAGGPEEYLPDLTEFDDENVIWAGADRGVYHIIQRDIKPQVAFGDFDSVSGEELKLIESKVGDLRRFHPEKNETDMELALNWALERKPDAIRLFGISGGRLDHLFANVQLLIPPLLSGSPIEINMFDRFNEVYLKGPGTYQVKKNQQQQYISFIPLTQEIPDLTLKGFKYPLTRRHISIGSTLCISNELVNDYGTFSFSQGILLVIRSHD